MKENTKTLRILNNIQKLCYEHVIQSNNIYISARSTGSTVTLKFETERFSLERVYRRVENSIRSIVALFIIKWKIITGNDYFLIC